MYVLLPGSKISNVFQNVSVKHHRRLLSANTISIFFLIFQKAVHILPSLGKELLQRKKCNLIKSMN